jgi:hypothetical protein
MDNLQLLLLSASVTLNLFLVVALVYARRSMKSLLERGRIIGEVTGYVNILKMLKEILENHAAKEGLDTDETSSDV